MDFNSYAEALATAKRINADTSMIQRITFGFGKIVWQVLVVEDDRFVAYRACE